MTKELKKALEELCSMKAPSIEYLLLKNGYKYEAGKVKELVTAYENSLPKSKKNKVEEVEYKFRNFYRCPYCGTEWEDVWDSTCDDDCPACGERHIEPYKSEDV